MLNVIVTGGSGSIGFNLFEFFEKNSYSYINVSRYLKEEGISHEKLNSVFWNNSDICIHLAGNNNNNIQTKVAYREYFEVNTDLTKKLFDQFIGSTCETFIYMSSVKAAADDVDSVLDESVIPNPINAYGKSKLAAEEYILSQKLPKGKRVYIL